MRGQRRVPKQSEILFAQGIALACGLDGQIYAESDHGLYAGDTRMLSTYRFSLGGHSFRMLGRSRSEVTHMEWVFQNPEIRQGVNDARELSLLLHLERTLDHGLSDTLSLVSFADHVLHLRLTLQLDADFADIFEVKRGSIAPRLNVHRVTDESGLVLEYRTHGFERATHIRFRGPERPTMSGALVVFDVTLAPHESYRCGVEVIPVLDGRPARRSVRPVELPPAPGIAADPLVADPFVQGAHDLRALAMSHDGEDPYVAAGVPWFLALFGRDTLVTALMGALDGPWMVRGALGALASRQATRFDDFRDEEPGKIAHEVRIGELARRAIVPHAAYYGTHDAPALYVLALWNAWRWYGDRAMRDDFFDAARDALTWCEQGGDPDRDGFLEYRTRSSQGYFNQSWKDAGDAILHEDGAMPELPLATVELQGYAFAARLAMAELLEHRGEPAEAARLRARAASDRERVEARFWMDDRRFYAVALDGRKRLVRSLASNPGHLLWCGLPSAPRASEVAKRLLLPDFFSGWGIRTLVDTHPSFNPLSYQLGSVWPHDNALIAAGFCRYGLYEAAAQVMRATLEAAEAFEESRLPEVFVGTDRRYGLPVPYFQANSPQAWAAAVPILFVQILLGLVPDAPRGRLFVDPWLPDWLPRLELRQIEIGGGTLDIVVERSIPGAAVAPAAIRSASVPRDMELVRGRVPAPLWGAPPAT